MEQEPFKMLSGRRRIPVSYWNASITFVGGACIIFLLYVFLDSLTQWGQPPIVPGLSFLAGLYYPVLFFWGGLMMRERVRRPSSWIYAIVICVSIIAFLFYADMTNRIAYSQLLYIATLCIGFLAPPEQLNPVDKKIGGFTLLMVVISAFCYTAVGVVISRYYLISFSNEHVDMDMLIYSMLVYSKAALTILSTYLLAQLSFTEIGQKIGSNFTVRWVAVISCILTCLLALRLAFLMPFVVIISHESFSPIMILLIQPAFIFLIGWCANKVRTKKTDNR